MSLDRFIEERISRAIAEGEFDNLPGKGKPLNLDWYFNLPEDFRLAYSILKTANCVPQEAQLMTELEALRRHAESCPEEERAQVNKAIAEKTLSLDLMIESRKRR